MTSRRSVELLVCTTCRHGLPAEGTAARDGTVLLDRLAGQPRPEGVVVRGVECLSNCTRGCTVALRGAGRWTYVYGNLDPQAHPSIVLEGAARYRETGDGLVPWRERPEHFRKNCIARIPPWDGAEENPDG